MGSRVYHDAPASFLARARSASTPAGRKATPPGSGLLVCRCLITLVGVASGVGLLGESIVPANFSAGYGCERANAAQSSLRVFKDPAAGLTAWGSHG